jgi:hypothetical protein
MRRGGCDVGTPVGGCTPVCGVVPRESRARGLQGAGSRAGPPPCPRPVGRGRDDPAGVSGPSTTSPSGGRRPWGRDMYLYVCDNFTQTGRFGGGWTPGDRGDVRRISTGRGGVSAGVRDITRAQRTAREVSGPVRWGPSCRSTLKRPWRRPANLDRKRGGGRLAGWQRVGGGRPVEWAPTGGCVATAAGGTAESRRDPTRSDPIRSEPPRLRTASSSPIQSSPVQFTLPRLG